jgi:UDP-glucose 4-epimerase
VIHFVVTLTGESMAHPDRYFRNNVSGTLNLPEVMRERGLGALVFLAKATYGLPPRSHCRGVSVAWEPLRVQADRRADDLVAFARRGFAATALRYFNRQAPTGRDRRTHQPETHLIPLAIAAAWDRAPHLEIYGADYPT